MKTGRDNLSPGDRRNLHMKCQAGILCKGPGCRAYTGKTKRVRDVRVPGVRSNVDATASKRK